MSKTYIQKSTDAKKDILSVYKITNKHIPDIQLELKDLFKRDWAEQQGDEEYIPATAMFKAYEQDLEFVCMDTLATAGATIKIFLAYLQGSEFSLYSEYNNRGFRCRYAGYDNKAFYREAEDVVVFSVKVKINNPLSYALSSATAGGSLSIDAGGSGAITISDGGTGFAPGSNNLTIVQTGASGGVINVTANSSGVITSVNSVVTLGSGYIVGSALSTTGGTGSGCKVNIVRVASSMITFTANSTTIAYWDDGTSNTYSVGTVVNKPFTTSDHFGIICPQKL